jgi:succinate dehydrogenase/fumarate reductase flavoprotein subunit
MPCRRLATRRASSALPGVTRYAYSATGGITFTFGGLKVNENAQVIGTDWRPITGLYCCGEMVGGLFYDNYPASTGLVSGATFGRIAGRNAATGTHEQVADTSYATRSVQPNPVHQPQPKKIAFAARGDHESEETSWVP